MIEGLVGKMDNDLRVIRGDIERQIMVETDINKYIELVRTYRMLDKLIHHIMLGIFDF